MMFLGKGKHVLGGSKWWRDVGEVTKVGGDLDWFEGEGGEKND